jgi:hypothetical protein
MVSEQQPAESIEVEAEQPLRPPIDEPLLEDTKGAAEQPQKAVIAQTQAEPQVNRRPTSHERRLGAVSGAIWGTILALTTMLLFSIYDVSYSGFRADWPVAFLSGAGWSIAGAIVGTSRNGIIGVLIGGAVAWFLPFMFLGYSDRILFAGAVMFAPVGAILGAIAHQILRRQLSKRARLNGCM